ncbi:glycoside hydrolase family 3 N-terminal domain-containing protein [Legionella septentrionalis]|uniref:glycoside hydrolase family 3 N-terminal domain-containing protein n=1 Tax=Legionella septentrionalis TaxID=2498109 RepID=UPI000F8CFFF2|nr:glycoside hydrolase family 3 N-terminal domain-containing protein [Legionella septentrionalis]RUQ97483.1 glycoside hydrolase family 3 protein [Legionella septentrionalis]RUR09779.1 glycoside hydrolase family 3 protein [Legionella septentrionalis]
MPHLRNKIGQMLIMGFAGYEINEDSPVAEWLKTDGLGGVLLFDFDVAANQFGKNLRDQEQIITLNRQLVSYANANPSEYNLPLYIALDYEGGVVDRLAAVPGCMSTVRPCDQALLSDEDLYQEAKKMALTLKKLGFNLNFAPVVDLNLNENEGIIGKLGRSFSSEPEEVVRAARQFVHAFNEEGIICTYKHFPGHGSAVGDTHLGFVDVTEHYHDNELYPYARLFTNNTPAMVMTAHVVNRQLDASGIPATLSYSILTDLLRHKLGFTGVVISDDLQMKAISEYYALDDALRMTINAGTDMLIFGNQLGQISATHVIDKIEQLVRAGDIPVARIEEAYGRISRLKQAHHTGAVLTP